MAFNQPEKRRRVTREGSPVANLMLEDDLGEVLVQHSVKETFKVPGLVCTNHVFRVPLDHTGEVSALRGALVIWAGAHGRSPSGNLGLRQGLPPCAWLLGLLHLRGSSASSQRPGPSFVLLGGDRDSSSRGQRAWQGCMGQQRGGLGLARRPRRSAAGSAAQ